MHLAGEADALHFGAGHAGLRQHAANGFHGGVPPVLGALLRPQGALHAHVLMGTEQPARTAPRSSTRSARELPVPISMPSHMHTSWHNPSWIVDARLAFRSTPKFGPPLDARFVPAALWNRAYRERVEARGGEDLAIALERGPDSVSVFRTRILPHQGGNAEINQRYVERLLKFLLWQKGGYRVTIGGRCRASRNTCGRCTAPAGERAFDHAIHGRAGYGRPMDIASAAFDAAPAERESAAPLGAASGWLPHRLRPGRERPQVRRGGRWRGGLQRRNALEPERASRPAIPLRRHPRFAAARRRAPAARGRHRRQRGGRVREQRGARRLALPRRAAGAVRKPRAAAVLRVAGGLGRHSLRGGQRWRGDGAGRFDGAGRQRRAGHRHGQQPGGRIRDAAGRHHRLAE